MAIGHKADCQCPFCIGGLKYHKLNCKCMICKRKNKFNGGSKEGASPRLVRQSQLPPFSKGAFMAHEFKDGRIETLDSIQLQKLIGELREKIIKEIAKCRFHFEGALTAEKRKAKCEERLAELGYYPIREAKKDNENWLRSMNR